MSYNTYIDDTPHWPESPEDKQKRLAWWKEARFGMFIHFGLYSGLAGELNGKRTNEDSVEWFQKHTEMDSITYKNLALPKFKPIEGCADIWARTAKDAGAEYVVLTTRHHEGFALFDSKFSDFTSKKTIDRDIVQEYARALRKHGLRVGIYYSVIDWQHRDYDYKTSIECGMPYPLGEAERVGDTPRDHSKYIEFIHNQMDELMTNYGEIDIVWFDFSGDNFEGEKTWKAHNLWQSLKDKNPQVMVNNRLYRRPGSGIIFAGEEDETPYLDPRYGDFMTPERHIPDTGIPGVDWEVAQTLNNTWGYSKYDFNFKSSESLIQQIVDIVSKGGNMLLNIGPKGDGTVDEYTIDRMSSIGEWMRKNSETIKGADKSPFDHSFDWGRVTSKKDALYLCLFKIPENGKLEIPADQIESDRIKSANFLGSEQKLQIKMEDGKIVIELGVTELPVKYVSVVKLSLAK